MADFIKTVYFDHLLGYYNIAILFGKSLSNTLNALYGLLVNERNV